MEGLYLRLSITDRCNLRCRYCMPAEGVPSAPHADLLTYEQVLCAVRAIHDVQPLRKVRLTGGEPLVRRDVVHLVGSLAEAFPATALCMTTNGQLLDRRAAALREAGLRRVNISLDTLRSDRYRAVTRLGELERVVLGIEAARRAGLTPVRLNCVVQEGFNDDEVEDLVDFALRQGAQLRFLEMMDIGEARRTDTVRYLSADAVIERLSRRYALRRLYARGTAVWYEAREGSVSTQVGLIRPVSSPFCGACDRVRLDARGRLYACLQTEDPVELPTLLDRPDDLRRAVREVLACKTRTPAHSRSGPMSAIGG